MSLVGPGAGLPAWPWGSSIIIISIIISITIIIIIIMLSIVYSLGLAQAFLKVAPKKLVRDISIYLSIYIYIYIYIYRVRERYYTHIKQLLAMYYHSLLFIIIIMGLAQAFLNAAPAKLVRGASLA